MHGAPVCPTSRLHSLPPPVKHILYEYTFTSSDFIWSFLRPYMGVIPNPNMAFIFPISCILALIFPILLKYFSVPIHVELCVNHVEMVKITHIF